MMTFKQFLLEGGVAGHMAHPYDLPNVNTGRDLINIFNKIAISLTKKPSAVKIDGVNASIKLITNSKGIKEFAMDRGSNKPEDVEGVTIDKLALRFPEGHGMRDTGKIVLEIFNQALPSVERELKQLKMWDNDNILFNMEFVKGATNVIGYVNNFLAIHGLNEIVQVKSPVRGSVSRASREISYDKKALQSLIETVKPIAKKYGFDVVNEFAVTLTNKIDFNPELNSKFSVSYDSRDIQTHSLRDWLSKAKNPGADKIKLASGKSIGAVSLENYKNMSAGVPLNHYLGANTKDYQKAIDGAVLVHATILMGQKIKDAATSELGSVGTQEGIVIRDSNISVNPLKITGNFFTGKETGRIKQLKTQEQEEGIRGQLASNNRVQDKMNYQTNPLGGKEGARLTLTPGMNI
jgi:hypothetical protein